MINKLVYSELKIEEVSFYVARSTARTMHITVKKDCRPYAVCNYRVAEREFERFLYEHLDWVRKAILKCKSKNDISIKMTLPELKKKIMFYVEKYIPVMNVYVKRITVRKMSTAWGSCTKNKNTIRFSKELVKCSDKFIEYVVVHEMAHLIEANHSRNFWSIVARYIPDYKKIRKNIEA